MSAGGVRLVAALGCVTLMAAPRLGAQQAELGAAVERARRAWVAHDVRTLVATSDTVRLRIPGVAASHAMRPGQAARLLGAYLGAAEAESLELKEIRPVGEGHAYAELERRHTVRGTADRRVEIVFFGFRRIEGRWRLREVRIAP